MKEKKRNLPVSPQALAGDAIARYDAGENIRDMAKANDLSPQAIYKALVTYRQDDWRTSQIARAGCAYEDAKAKLADMERMKPGERDMVGLGIVKEQLRSAQWELERLLSRLYGQKQELKVDVTVGLAERLIRARERVVQIEHGSAT